MNLWKKYVCFCRDFVDLSQVRYEHPYQEKRDPIGASLFLIRRLGLEPIKMQQSGGLLHATA